MNQIYTNSPACPCCCSAYMEEHDIYWVCPVCGAVFKKVVGIYREANLNYKSKNLIPMGVHPVF